MALGGPQNGILGPIGGSLGHEGGSPSHNTLRGSLVVHCVYIVYAKYQMASVKALVQVEFPYMYALCEH